MTRSLTLTLLVLALGGCSLDLAKLSAGGDAGAEPVDGGPRDASAPDGDVDGGPLDGGGCGCVGAGWQSSQFIVGGTDVSDVAISDLDGDGDGDIVASLRGATVGAAFLQVEVTGCGRDGLTSAPAELLTDVPPDVIVAVARWDEDEVPDILAPDPSSSLVRVLRGNVSSAFYSVFHGSDAPSAIGSYAAFAADLSGSGDDVVVLGQRDGTLFADRGGAREPQAFVLGDIGLRIAFGARTGAGVLAAVAEPTSIEILRFDPSSETPAQIVGFLPVPAGTLIADVDVVDVDGDEIEDVVVADASRLSIYLGTAAGTFSVPIDFVGRARVAVTSGNVDGDARPEVIALAVGSSGSGVEIYASAGSAITMTSEIALDGATSIAVADVDADGQLDIVVGDGYGGVGRVTVLRRVCL